MMHKKKSQHFHENIAYSQESEDYYSENAAEINDEDDMNQMERLD